MNSMLMQQQLKMQQQQIQNNTQFTHQYFANPNANTANTNNQMMNRQQFPPMKTNPSQVSFSSSHQQVVQQPQMPRAPVSQIHVPEDYDEHASQEQHQKEKFFESLGLPPDLSDQSMKLFQNQQQQQQMQRSGTQGTLDRNQNQTIQSQEQQHMQDGGDSNMFRSCNTAGGGYQMTSNQKGLVYTQPQQFGSIGSMGGAALGHHGGHGSSMSNLNNRHNTSFKTANNGHQQMRQNSESSFLTAYDNNGLLDGGQQIQSQGTPGGQSRYGIATGGPLIQSIGGGVQIDPLSASAHFPSRHSDSMGGNALPRGPLQIDEIKKFEDLFIDSQRKHSAPVLTQTTGNHNSNPFSAAGLQQPTPESQRINRNDDIYGQLSNQSSMNQMQFQQQQQQIPQQSFNNTVHAIQPYAQQQQQIQAQQQQSFRSSSNRNLQMRREILTISVEITDGEVADILIREGDDPKELANEFANKYGIQSEQLKELLAEQVQEKLEAFLAEEEQMAASQSQKSMGGQAAYQVAASSDGGAGFQQLQGLDDNTSSPIMDGISLDYRNQQYQPQPVANNYASYNSTQFKQDSSNNLLANDLAAHPVSQQQQFTNRTSTSNQQQQQLPYNNNNNQQSFNNAGSNSMLLRQSAAAESNYSSQQQQQKQQQMNSGVYQNEEDRYSSMNNVNNSMAVVSQLNQFNQQQQRSGSYSQLPQYYQTAANNGSGNHSFNASGAMLDRSQHSFAAARGGFQLPGTSTYEQWKESVSSQLKHHHMNQPMINDNSRRIIENKRLLNSNANNNSSSQRKLSNTSASGSGNPNITVHHRLHQQALSKQRHFLQQQQQLYGQPQQHRQVMHLHHTLQSSQNFQSANALMGGGGGSTKNLTRKVFNLNGGNGSNQSSPFRNGQHQTQTQQVARNRSNSAQDQQQHDTNNSSMKPPVPIINYGERLYQKGLKRKEEQSRLLKEVKAQQEQAALQQFCSFQPQINEVSKLIAHPLRTEGQTAEDALIKYGQQVREKIEQKRSEKLFQELSECRFHPVTNKSRYYQNSGYESDGVLQEQRHQQNQWRQNSADRGQHANPDKFSNLYKDALRRKERQEKIYSACIGPECTFKPDTTVSKYYYQRLESRDPAYQQHRTIAYNENGRFDVPPRGGSVPRGMRANSASNGEGGAAAIRGRGHYRNLSEGNRIHEKERLQRSLKKSATLSNDLFDPDSGMPWAFRPRVGRGPRNQHRPDPRREKGATGHMLYQQSKALQERLDSKKRMQDQEKIQQMKRAHTNEKSKAIIEEMKIQHFSNIFRRLDSDSDGTISAQRIDLSLLEPELLGVLQLIFIEMEETGHTLTEEEFIDASYRLYDSLPLPQKKMLFNPKQIAAQQKTQKSSRQQYYNSQQQHRPKLDSNSIKIAAQNRPSNENIAEILYRKKQEYDQRIMERKQEKENQELVGCTFHPNILQSPLSPNQTHSGIKIYSQNNNSRGSLSKQSSMNYNTTTNQHHNQSFNGGSGVNQSSQHTATFHNPQNANTFDLNTLAYNVANEYLMRPPLQQQQQINNHSSSSGNLHQSEQYRQSTNNLQQSASQNVHRQYFQSQQMLNNVVGMSYPSVDIRSSQQLQQPILQQKYATTQQ